MVKCNGCKHFNGYMQWMETFWWLNAMNVNILWLNAINVNILIVKCNEWNILMVKCNQCKHFDG